MKPRLPFNASAMRRGHRYFMKIFSTDGALAELEASMRPSRMPADRREPNQASSLSLQPIATKLASPQGNRVKKCVTTR